MVSLPVNGHGEPDPIVDYFVIFYPSISPNGDGVKDYSPVKLHISSQCNYLALTLEDTLLTTVFDTLFSKSEPDTGEYTFNWTGLDSTAALLPDGKYVLHLYTENDTSSWNEYKEVVVDTTRPVVTIDRIEPGIFLPGIPGKEDRIIIYYTLTNIGPGDSTTASITRPDETVEMMDLHEEVSGDHSIEWSGDESIPDGYYTVSFRVDDEAGNSSSDNGFFEVDNAGPAIVFVDSLPYYTNNTPQVIEGTCFDRNGVEGLELSWNNSPPVAPDSTFEVGDTLHWLFNVEDSVKSQGVYVEGQYKLSVSCSDSFGHSTTKVMTFYIDTTPPAPPYLRPVPARVNDRELVIVGEADKSEADSVLIRYTDEVDTVLIKKRLLLDEFSATLDLFDGNNTVWAFAKDKAGNSSSISNVINVEYRVVDELVFPEVFRSADYFRIYSTKEIQSVQVKIFTINGRLVRTLSKYGPASKFEIMWDLLNEDGSEVNNGPYLAVITIEYPGSRRVEKKLIAVVR